MVDDFVDREQFAVVAGGEGFEVTTYRADVETDGRRAVVRFSADMAEDARRRDFTMNALYAAPDGRVSDPLCGLPDLQARRVRFIEDATRRIREDYLRILRFFRFSAWYGDPDNGWDAEALAAIADNLDGIATLSRERVGQEVLKLMAAPDPAPAVAVMAQTGALAATLPGAVPDPLGPLVAIESHLGLLPDGLRRLAVTGFEDAQALRLSKAKAKRLELLRQLIGSPQDLPEIAWRHGADTARDAAALRAASLGQWPDPDTEARIAKGAQAKFPVTARDLMPDYEGAALGRRLQELEAEWIASGMTLTCAQLLAAKG